MVSGYGTSEVGSFTVAWKITSARKASPRAKVFPHATPRFKTLTEFNEHRCAHPFLTESGLLWKVAEPTIFSSHG